MRGEPFIAPPDQQGLGFGEKRLPPAGHQAHPPKPEPQGQRIEYRESCRCFGHEPACASYHAHVTRLYHERIAAGGEAELKAKVKFWEKVGMAQSGSTEGVRGIRG